MAIFPRALPVSGNSKAADNTTSTTTTTTISASNETSNNNANINGDNAADSSIDALFGGDVDYSDAAQFAEDSRAVTTSKASNRPEALRSVLSINEDTADTTALEGLAPRREDYDLFGADFGQHEDMFAGQSASQPTSPERRAEPPNPDRHVSAANANGIAAVQASALSAQTPPHRPVLPLLGPRQLQDPERVVPANDALVNNAPADGAPAKRPRGRPPGKAPPKAPVRYRCRYGCDRIFEGDRALRKHMMRVHCLFSTAHKELVKCGDCGRTIDPNIKELACNKRTSICKELTVAEETAIEVTAPRDEREAADTFAYANSNPSRLVIVQDGDDEDEWHLACLTAIAFWPARAPANPAESNHGLMTPGETPSPQNEAALYLAGGDEQVPAPPARSYTGKGKGRAMMSPVANLAGGNVEVPALPKKRAGDFPPEGEPVAKRTTRNVSYNETEAFAVAAPSNLDVGDLLAMHEADFPLGDFGDVNGFDLADGTAFGYDAFVMPDDIEGDANGFDFDFAL